MASNRLWTIQEIEYLENNWGVKEISVINKRLNRSTNSIRLYAKRLGLGGATVASEFVTARRVAQMLNVDIHTVINYWIKLYGLRAKYDNRTGNKYIWYIKIDDLVNWLKKNQSKWDSRRVELYALGIEPEWLKLKRTNDRNKPSMSNKKWTREEDARAIILFKQGYRHSEIAIRMNRSAKAVRNRINRLDVWGTGEYIG